MQKSFEGLLKEVMCLLLLCHKLEVWTELGSLDKNVYVTQNSVV